jgi:hypothetical protein
VLAVGFTTPVDGFKCINVDFNPRYANPVDIRIDGKGQVVDAHGKDSFFYVRGNSSLFITGLTMQNGHSDGFGGAIMVANVYREHGPGHLELVKCTLKNNTADENGGGVASSGGSVILTLCTFDGNSGDGGGAVYMQDGSMILTSCTFNGNRGGDEDGGGAVYVIGGVSATIISCSFKGGTGSNVDSILKFSDNQAVTFACPSTSTGAPVKMADGSLMADQLPPAKEIVHCTPKPTPAPPSPTKKYVCHRPGTAPGQCVVVTTGGVSLKDCTEVCN